MGITVNCHLYRLTLTNASLRCSFIAVTRLFRIILDVTSPAFNVEDRQWRSSVIDVFYYYFSAAWADEKVFHSYSGV
jgi:hypothetical protein